MGRYPVDDHADALLMAVVDEVPEVVGRAVARRGSEIAGHLIAPRREKRVLGDGHQFHVRETETLHVIDQTMSKLAVRERAIAFLGNAYPRAGVKRVDGNRE